MADGHSKFRVLALASLLAAGTIGCSKSASSDSASGGASTAGASGASSGGGRTGAGGSSYVPTSGANNSGFPDDTGVYVGTTTDVTTKLPPLPAMSNVVAQLNDDSTKITFDPVDGALDYRVFELPSDGDISVQSGGGIVVKNGTYRCSGNRETAPPVVDDAAYIASDAIHVQVDKQMVDGTMRTLADATLGYVYTGPGPGLVPVYVLGDADPQADTTCFFARWAASRTKKYTTSKDEHDQLLKASARDDGIAFYVPSAATATSKQIYEFTDSPASQYQARYYFGDGPEADAHASKIPAFLVESAAGPNLQPLMRVFYGDACGWSHDELAVGHERFNRIYNQGDQLPLWSLLWSGITGPTTLVVEALDSGCPYQGHLSPTSFPSVIAVFGTLNFIHEPYITLDQARAASATTEVFINGQAGPPWVWDTSKLTNGMQAASAPVPLPKAIARSFVKVKPNPHPKMDFFDGFAPGSTPEVFTETACDSPMDCPITDRQTSPTFDQTFTEIEVAHDTLIPLSTFGQVNGELWVTYGDAAADTNGKFRLTAKQKATMDTATFLHVTMEANAYSSARRYPQILITDQDAPVQFRLPQGHTIIVQTRGEEGGGPIWPVDYQIELCNMRGWDVNNQCPVYDLHHIPGLAGGADRLAPNAEVGELAAADQRVIFDVYASTQRVYLFLDSKPYACAELPAGAAPSGPVTVTWGDVLYHSAVDGLFEFHTNHLQIDTSRHFDNLGFSSGVPAPGWDESTFPCVAPITL
jgi:hypothetical protein